MVNRIISVGDDFTLPASVNTTDANLPAASKAAAIALKLDADKVGAANGVAALGADSKVADANLPSRLGATELNATYVPASGDSTLTGKKSFNGLGKMEFNDGFSPNYDTVLWIASKPRVNPTLNSQGLYIQHRVSGNLGGLVNDAAASELRISDASNTGAGQSAHENSLVVTGGANTIGDIMATLSNFHTSGTPTGTVQNVMLYRGTQIPPLAPGFVIDTAYGLHLDPQIVGTKNYSIWAPDGDSVLGPLVPKDTASASLRAQAITGQTGPVIQALGAKPSSTTIFRINANATGGIGGQITGPTWWINNNIGAGTGIALAIRGRSDQTADLTQWQDGAGAVLAKVTATGAVKASAVVTGSRPSAATSGAGAQVYDTTLSKPIWSDGTVWRDAMGTAV